jgi:SnoaL-like domain
MSQDQSNALQVLLDKQAIAEVLIRYARACDRADEQMLRSCFHPDSVHRHGRFQGKSSDFVDFAMKIILGTKLERHLMTNIMVEVDGDSAVSECYYLAYHRQPNPQTQEDEDYFQGGRFIDRLEKRNGEWRIAARVGLVDFERFDPLAERFVPQLEPKARSHRSPQDELYALLPSLRKRS